jgi:hypothetical protein
MQRDLKQVEDFSSRTLPGPLIETLAGESLSHEAAE